MICRVSDEYNFYRPRMYRQKARKDYLALVKCRKRGAKKIRKAIKKQLQYVRCDLGYKDSDSKAEKKIAYKDNTDRIEVERKFSLAKRKFGLGLLLTKREDTTRASIVLSIIAMNIDRLAVMLLRFRQIVINIRFSYCLPVCCGF